MPSQLQQQITSYQSSFTPIPKTPKVHPSVYTFRNPHISYATVVATFYPVATLVSRLDPDYAHGQLHSFTCRRNVCKWHHPYG